MPGRALVDGSRGGEGQWPVSGGNRAICGWPSLAPTVIARLFAKRMTVLGWLRSIDFIHSKGDLRRKADT